jgi:hypothetical protein
MRALFRRKTTTDISSDPRQTDSSDSTSPDYSFMAAWLELPGSSIPADPAPEFSKLRSWLAKHPDTAPHFVLRFPIAGPSATDHSSCFLLLKSQILQSFQFIAKCDKLLNNSGFVQAPPLPDHPFQAGRHLTVVRRTWGDILRWHACLRDLEALRQEDRSHLETRIGGAKSAVGALIALLASADAIPSPYVPVVNFDSFEIDGDDIHEAIGRLKDEVRKGSRCLLAMANASSSIANMTFAYSMGGQYERPELQIQLLHDFIGYAAEKFDRERNCMSDEFDGTPFADFFMHPESMSHPILARFMEPGNQNARGLKDFVRLIVNHYNFHDLAKAQMVNAVVTQMFAAPFAPTLVFDGPGTLEKGELDLALELIATDDPLRLLAVVGNAGTGEDAGEAVKKADAAMAVITSSGKSVLAFAYEFSTPNYLTEKGAAVRTAIAEFLGIEV